MQAVGAEAPALMAMQSGARKVFDKVIFDLCDWRCIRAELRDQTIDLCLRHARIARRLVQEHKFHVSLSPSLGHSGQDAALTMG